LVSSLLWPFELSRQGLLDVGDGLLSRWIGEAPAELGAVNIFEPLVDPPEVALRIAYPCDPLPEGKLGRLCHWPSAGRHSAIERLLSGSDIDPQMRRRSRPLRPRIEQHDHSVAELDFNVADPAIGTQHPRSRRLLSVEGLCWNAISASVSELITHGSTRE